jgi:hypothetical protein
VSGERNRFGLFDAVPTHAPADDFRRSVQTYSLTGVAVTRMWNGDWFYAADPTAAAVTVTLPIVGDEMGHHHLVKRVTGGANAVKIVASDGSAILDGSATHSIAAQYGVRCYFSDGSAWRGTLSPASVSPQSAWTSYSATATAGTGAFTTVSTVGSYLKTGSLVHLKLTVTNTTNGTAATSVRVNLPFAVVGRAVGSGRDTTLTGNMVQGDFGNPDANTVELIYYNSTYPSGSGGVLIFNGFYEAAP